MIRPTITLFIKENVQFMFLLEKFLLDVPVDKSDDKT